MLLWADGFSYGTNQADAFTARYTIIDSPSGGFVFGDGRTEHSKTLQSTTDNFAIIRTWAAQSFGVFGFYINTVRESPTTVLTVLGGGALSMAIVDISVSAINVRTNGGADHHEFDLIDGEIYAEIGFDIPNMTLEIRLNGDQVYKGTEPVLANMDGMFIEMPALADGDVQISSVYASDEFLGNVEIITSDFKAPAINAWNANAEVAAANHDNDELLPLSTDQPLPCDISGYDSEIKAIGLCITGTNETIGVTLGGNNETTVFGGTEESNFVALGGVATTEQELEDQELILSDES